MQRIFQTLLGALLLSAGWVTPASAESVTYCIDPAWAPYEALRNNEHIGISRDYLELVGRRTGINFVLVPSDSLEQSLAFVREGKCQMITLLNSSPSRKQFLDFSVPYFEAPNVLVGQRGTPMIQGFDAVGERLVGVVEGYRHAEYLARYYPSVNVRTVDSEALGLVSLARGEIDLMIGSLLSVYLHMNNMELDQLEVVGYAEPFDSLGYAVSKAVSKSLLPRLNTALNAIPESRRVTIYKNWTDVRIRDERSYLTLLLALTVVGLIVIGFYLRHRAVAAYTTALLQKTTRIEALQAALLEKNRTLEFLSNHDALTGLFNRNHMIHKAEEEISRFLRFHTPASLIIAEIDNLSELDASHGSQHADDLLRAVAATCVDTVREVDVVARWSGEQFIILCPQTDIHSAKVLGERLVKGLYNNDVVMARNPDIAVGLAVVHSSESFTDWFDRAAKALYQSKRQGYGVPCTAE